MGNASLPDSGRGALLFLLLSPHYWTIGMLERCSVIQTNCRNSVPSYKPIAGTAFRHTSQLPEQRSGIQASPRHNHSVFRHIFLDVHQDLVQSLRRKPVQHQAIGSIVGRCRHHRVFVIDQADVRRTA